MGKVVEGRNKLGVWDLASINGNCDIQNRKTIKTYHIAKEKEKVYLSECRAPKKSQGEIRKSSQVKNATK